MRQQSIRRVTLQDIARETGYSVNTVSHALRDKADIAPATRSAIQRVAREMGYAPNQVASSLRSGVTKLFAVILGSMSNPFYGIMTDTLQDAAQAAGYALMTMCSREDAALELKLVEQAISQCVDGILLFPTQQSRPTIERLRASGTPFVLMARDIAPGEADSVVGDEAQGAYLATRHLIERGGRRLAFLAANRVVFSTEQRLRGFHRACDEAGVSPEDRRVRVLGEAYPDMAGDARVTRELRELKRAGFDSLFVFCDVEAWHTLSAMQHAPDLGPRDFAIVSFDNIEGALNFPIPLCSVGCDYSEMAREAVRLLRERIDGDDRPPRTVVCPVALYCRESCGRN